MGIVDNMFWHSLKIKKRDFLLFKNDRSSRSSAHNLKNKITNSLSHQNNFHLLKFLVLPAIAFINWRNYFIYCSLTPATGGKFKSYSQGGFFRMSSSYQRNMIVVFFVTLSLNNLDTRDKWRHYYIYFRFLLQIYKLNFCKSKKGWILPLPTWMAMNTRVTLTNVITLNVRYSPQKSIY